MHEQRANPQRLVLQLVERALHARPRPVTQHRFPQRQPRRRHVGHLRLPAHPRHEAFDRRVVARHRGDLIADARFRRRAPVRAAAAGAHVVLPAGLMALPGHRQQPRRALLGQQRVDGPLPLPAGGELGPARTQFTTGWETAASTHAANRAGTVPVRGSRVR